MTLNGAMALILRYFTEFGSSGAHSVKVIEDVVVKSSRSLSYLLMSFLLNYFANSQLCQKQEVTDFE